MPADRITFAKGDPVPWPPAPGGIAQIDDLRRTCVRLVYAARTGRLRFPVVAAAEVARLAAADPVLPMANPMGRGVVRPGRAREYLTGG